MFWSSLDGRGVSGRMAACIHMAESLRCSPETPTAFLISYFSKQSEKFKTWEKKKPSSSGGLLEGFSEITWPDAWWTRPDGGCVDGARGEQNTWGQGPAGWGDWAGGDCSGRMSWENWPRVPSGSVERRTRHPGSGTWSKVTCWEKPGFEGVMPPASLAGGRRRMTYEDGGLCLLFSTEPAGPWHLVDRTDADGE